MDASDFGRYGALSLLKRNDPNTIVATYPIDDAEVTFGRDQTCSIRLYYPSVSGLHCKLLFNETDSSSAAFLVVLGTNGVLVDGDAVYPSAPGAPPTTVPLPNGSTLDIYKKRFRFAFPPKYLRPVLLASPSPRKSSRRALRMSMIASAQVFSPRPSTDPRENLRVLQSPLKQSRDEAEIVLVESDTPRVVEADKDLVILDEVNVPPPPLPAPVFTPMPRTPARRPRNSLHRAVLIRSAQRAELRREMWQEEERDVEEVEEFITPVKERDEEEDEDGDVPMANTPSSSRPKSSWRKSLEAGLSWALGLQQENAAQEEETEAEAGMAEDVAEEEYEDGVANEEDAMDEDHENMDAQDGNQGYNEHDENNENDFDNQEDAEEHLYPTMEEIRAAESEEPPTPPARPLGKFMTPQPASSQAARRAGRYSLGGTGPRRVRLVEPWKIEDIVVPLKMDDVKEDEEPEPEEKAQEVEESPRRGWGTRSRQTSPAKADRTKLTSEEREAIRDRRRSAAITPDTFFNGQAPGLAPATPRPAPPSPTKESASAAEDTHVMLARMREMVDSAKRRQSLNPFQAPPPTPGASPRKHAEFSLLASGSDHGLQQGRERERERELEQEQESETEVESERDRSPVRSTSLGRAPPMPRPAGPEKEEEREREQPMEVEVGYTGVRALFTNRATVPATPRMDGVKAMFLREAHVRKERAPQAGPSEPEEALESVGELLQTPAGWRAARAPVVEEEPAEDPESAAEPMEMETDTSTSLSESNLPKLAAPKAIPRPRTKVAGSSTQPNTSRTLALPKAPRTLRGRFGPPAPEPVRAAPQTAPAKVPAPKLPAPAPVAAAAAPPADIQDAPAAAAVRRTRRAAPESERVPEPEAEEASAPAPKAPLRRTTRTKTPTPEPVQSAPARTSRRQAAQIEAGGTGTGLGTGVGVGVGAEDAQTGRADGARVRRTARSRIPAAVGTIKEEQEDAALLGAPAAAQTRAVPSSAPAAARTRASARKAATPVPDLPAEKEKEKENTPEPGEDGPAPGARKVGRRRGEGAEPAAGAKAAGSRIARGGRGGGRR